MTFHFSLTVDFFVSGLGWGGVGVGGGVIDIVEKTCPRNIYNILNVDMFKRNVNMSLSRFFLHYTSCLDNVVSFKKQFRTYFIFPIK